MPGPYGIFFVHESSWFWPLITLSCNAYTAVRAGWPLPKYLSDGTVLLITCISGSLAKSTRANHCFRAQTLGKAICANKIQISEFRWHYPECSRVPLRISPLAIIDHHVFKWAIYLFASSFLTRAKTLKREDGRKCFIFFYLTRKVWNRARPPPFPPTDGTHHTENTIRSWCSLWKRGFSPSQKTSTPRIAWNCRPPDQALELYGVTGVFNQGVCTGEKSGVLGVFKAAVTVAGFSVWRVPSRGIHHWREWRCLFISLFFSGVLHGHMAISIGMEIA